jgi:hypothetical protein
LAVAAPGNVGERPSNCSQAKSSNEDPAQKLRGQLIVVVTFAAFAQGSPAAAQNGIVIDWGTRTVVSSPSTLGSTLTTTVLRNINDVLYDYDVDIVDMLRPTDDFSHIAGAVRNLGISPRTAAARTWRRSARRGMMSVVD